MKTRMTMRLSKTIVAGLLCSGFLHPVNAQWQIISDFDDGVPDWQFESGTMQQPTFIESDGQLLMTAAFPATLGSMVNSFASLGWAVSHELVDAETIEVRVDIIRLSGTKAFAGIAKVSAAEKGNYALLMNAEQVYLEKVDWASGLVFARLFHDTVSLPTENLVLSLEMTRIVDSLRFTCRVLDQTHEAVLFERSVIDSPGIDPTILEVPELNTLQTDPGPPYLICNSVFLHLDQITDGNQPKAEVRYDNLRYESRSAALLQIEKAIRLSWPAFSTPFVVEGAPGVDGPWQEIDEPVVGWDGMNLMTVPAPVSETMKVFQLRQSEAP
jgi:hypothetical protein